MLAADTDNIISIDSSCVKCFELQAELSLPKRMYLNGKIKVEGKKEMKSRQVSSPNLFDACKMAFSIKKPNTNKQHRNIPSRSIGVRDPGVGM